MKVYNSLQKIQAELKCAKTLYNNFGGYHYRSAEAILESLKPLLEKYSCLITINDSIELIGDRFYVKATASLIHIEDCSTVSTCAYAREDLSKKGQDSSQVTGSTSSYARKYALNGLFCIDDTKDSDATNTGASHKSSERTQAIKEAKAATSMKDLESVWNKYTALKTDPAFKSLIKELKKKFL